MNPTRLSEELRNGRGDHLADRRTAVLLSLVSMGCMGVISLFQIGIIKHIPDPPLPLMDADRVDSSEEAYGHFQVGGAFLGMISYSVTAALAAAGGKERARRQSWIPLTLAGKAAVDAFNAGRLTYDQFSKHRAACFWCLIAAASTVATAFVVAPEAKTAWKAMVRGRAWRR